MSTLDILRAEKLCTIATCGNDGIPNAATVFYVFDEKKFLIHILTAPDTIHGQHICQNGHVALTVFSTTQKWTADKRGLQIYATGKRTPSTILPGVLKKYLNRYRGFSQWVKGVLDMKKIQSRFFTLRIEKIKIFDEPTFGKDVWVEVEVRT